MPCGKNKIPHDLVRPKHCVTPAVKVSKPRKVLKESWKKNDNSQYTGKSATKLKELSECDYTLSQQ